MTQEEKAKAYDKAKYIMKEYLESGNAGVIAENTIRKAFPELVEPEDERIRKDIVTYLKSILSNKKYGDKFIESWIAWLEKQERKPADSYCQENCKGFQETGKCFADGECKAKKEAEQKSDWSEDDTQYINDTLALLSFGCSIHSIREVQEWLQSLSNRVQPKQVWSEEDEKEVAILEAYIRSNDWSESHIDRALGIVDELVNKVKSPRLQSQWKPSEEQMIALDIAICCGIQLGTWEEESLKSLKEQLFKL